MLGGSWRVDCEAMQPGLEAVGKKVGRRAVLQPVAGKVLLLLITELSAADRQALESKLFLSVGESVDFYYHIEKLGAGNSHFGEFEIKANLKKSLRVWKAQGADR